jgi:hypothetical protein
MIPNRRAFAVRRIRWTLGLLAAAVLLGLGYVFAYTPTRPVTVVNDLGRPIDVSGCTSDGVVVIGVAGSALVDALAGRDDTCDVYDDLPPARYLGCLLVPRSGSVVRASRLRLSVKEADC